jgi:beta-hydroxylase
MLLFIILLFILILLIAWTWYHPECILIPLNLLYNTDSSLRKLIYTSNDKNIIFPTGKLLEDNWKTIRDEGYNIYNSLTDRSMNYLDNYHMNIGNENKKRWTTIPLRVFGKDSKTYMDMCPFTSKILQDHDEIKSCIYSIMEPGKIIQPHVGPYDGLLRYQLALDIPIPNNEQKCYLYVGDEQYSWIEGEGILFDEANLHGAVNTTDNKEWYYL